MEPIEEAVLAVYQEMIANGRLDASVGAAEQCLMA